MENNKIPETLKQDETDDNKAVLTIIKTNQSKIKDTSSKEIINIELPKSSIDIPISKETKKYSGLFNQGNTCYLNSLLQCLFMTPEFRQRLFSWQYNKKTHGDQNDCIPFQLQKLFARLNQRFFPSESTEGLTKSFQWGASQVSEQHDIQELCRVLFDALEQSAEQSNFINSLFEGETESVVKCLECNYESINKEKFLDLSLPIRNEFDNIYNTSLEMALLNLIKEEHLEKTNQYFCSQCKKKVDAVKFTRFSKTPDVLFLQLNRFDFDFINNSRRKIHDRVTFPDELQLGRFVKNTYSNLSKTTYSDENLKKLALMTSFASPITDKENKDSKENELIYDLYSVVIHAGNAQTGHYHSYIKSFEDRNWYKFNDHVVYYAHNEELQTSFGGSDNSFSSSTAYCIMYVKRELTNKHQNFQFSDFKLNEYLVDYLEKENIIVAEEMKKREERMNTITLRFNIEGTNFPIEVKKYNTIKELKLKLLEKGVVSFPNEKLLEEEIQKNESSNNNKIDDKEELSKRNEFLISNFRVRLFHLNKKMEILDYDLNSKLEDSGFYSHKTYTIETKLPDQEFEPYEPDKISLLVYFWNQEGYKNILNDSSDFTEDSFKYSTFKIHKKATYSQFKTELTQFYHQNMKEMKSNDEEKDNNSNSISNFNSNNNKDTPLLGFTKTDYGVNNFKIRELFNPEILLNEFKSKKMFQNQELQKLLETEIHNLFITDNTKVFIEQVDSLSNSNFFKFFEEKCLNVKIKFNLPFSKEIKPKIGNYFFDNEIEIKKTKTMRELKKRISDIINYNCNEFIMRKNTHNGIEIKNLNDFLEKYTSSVMKIFIELGTPMKESEIKISVNLCEESYEHFNICPFVFSKIGNFSVDLLWTFKELKSSLIKEIESYIKKINENKEKEICSSNVNNLSNNRSSNTNTNGIENSNGNCPFTLVSSSNNKEITDINSISKDIKSDDIIANDKKVVSKPLNNKPTRTLKIANPKILNSSTNSEVLLLDSIKKILSQLEKLNWDKVILRDFYNEKPTLIFPEDITLKDYDFKAGKILLLQEYKNINDIVLYDIHTKKNKENKNNNKAIMEIPDFLCVSKNKIQVTLRKWEPNNWKLTEPIDAFIPKKKINNLFLCSIINRFYPEIKVSKLMC